MAGDREAFVAAFVTSSAEQAKAVAAMADFYVAAGAYQKAMLAAYGKNAIKLGSRELVDDKWLDSVRVTVDGDRAVAVKLGQDKPLALVKTGHGWRIIPDALLNAIPGADLARKAKMCRAIAAAHDAAAGTIGKSGYSAEGIEQQLHSAILNAIFTDMQQTPRPGGAAPAAGASPLVIEVRAFLRPEGTPPYVLGPKAMTLEQLTAAVAAAARANGNVKILIRSQRTSLHADIAAAINACSQAGIRAINIATEKPPAADDTR